MDDSRFDTLSRALVTGHTSPRPGVALGGLPFSGLARAIWAG